MDHLPWYESATLEPVKVLYVCGEIPRCIGSGDEFTNFPQTQGWELGESESLAQLAARVQAWLFFGLLSEMHVSADALVERDGPEEFINTKMLPHLWPLDRVDSEEAYDLHVDLTMAVSFATEVMMDQVIPLLRHYEAIDPLDLWNSKPLAILFSVDVLLDLMKREIREAFTDDLSALRGLRFPQRSTSVEKLSIDDQSNVSDQSSTYEHSSISEQSETATQSDPTAWPEIAEQSVIREHSKSPEQSSISSQSSTVESSSVEEELHKHLAEDILWSGSVLPKLTNCVARSLLRAGKCGSLARSLDLTSSELYQLMSLPTSLDSRDHRQCSEMFCSCFNVNQTTYRTRHTTDCVMCDGAEIDELKLVDLIRKDQVPVIKSTIDRHGHLSIRVERMTKGIDYTAISHVWAGGLGNFEKNELPTCQLKAIHRDVCRTTVSLYRDLFRDYVNDCTDNPEIYEALHSRYASLLTSWLTPTTCYYWMDTLCIPNNHPTERKEAINSMGRIYAGAVSVLVLDPTLSGVKSLQLGKSSAKMVVQASPWMARSWPLQEAALASTLYVKFADDCGGFDSTLLGISVTLDRIPNQENDAGRLEWFSSAHWNNFTSVSAKALTSMPGDDFVKVWNLLAKRTTSYADDVPAIFAALLHQSAGKILAMEPGHRVWSLLHLVDDLPLDILCVELDSRLPQWKPKLPGSRNPVLSLDTIFGVMHRVATGFILLLEDAPTRALICPEGLPRTGGHVLLHDAYLDSVLVDLREPYGPSASSKGKSRHLESDESHLILLLRKRVLGSLSENCGILCKITGEDESGLRVQLVSNAITWRPWLDSEEDLVCETRDWLPIEPTTSILIEMATEHWPPLASSRFNAYPYRHLLVQVFRWKDWSVLIPQIASLGFPIFLFVIFALSWDGGPLLLISRVLGVVILTSAVAVVRICFAILYWLHVYFVQNRRARYYWSLSFWDAAGAQRELSRIPFVTPWYVMTFDLTIVVALAIFLYGWYEDDDDSFLHLVRSGLVISMEIEHGTRVLWQLFLRTQWFLSTLEYRGPWRSKRLGSRLVTSTLTYVSSAIQANLFLFCIACLPAAGGFAGFWLLMEVSRRNGGEGSQPIDQVGSGDLYWLVLLRIMGFGGTGIALCILSMIIWDLVARAIWVYGRDGWTWQERDADREIELA